jgi:cysteine desulfurase
MNVYLDNNATTAPDPRVLEEMLPYFKGKYGNPSALYSLGREAKQAIERSREIIAGILGVFPGTVCFTGSGTEADNMALFGAARALREKGRHIITSAVEHSAILNSCAALGKEGFEVTFVKPDRTGMITREMVAREARAATVLISVMHANNETGTINPIGEIGAMAGERGIVMHTDAVQSFCKIPCAVDKLNVDLLSLSAHKIHGPKGAGALYIGPNVPFSPLVFGGHQEEGRRAGTENVAGIAGLGKAAELSHASRDAEAIRIHTLRDRLERGLLRALRGARLNGHAAARLPNTLNISFPFVEAEALLLELDLRGVAVSSGSACTSGTGEPSHVLLAMGIPPEICRGALRFSLGRDNTAADVDYVLGVLPEIVTRIQAMSPLSAA